MNPRSKARGARAAIGLALGVFATAFLVRIANFGFVFVEGRVRFPSGRDELYHVRRIVYQVLRFPERLDFDAYVSFPFGARPVWPPYLDWLLAGLVRVFVPGDDALAVERWIVWLPPLLGAATVVGVFEIGRRHFSLLAGCVAGLLLALLPAHHVHSQLGQVDHQVVVGLFATLLLASAMALLSARDPARGRWWLAPAVGALSAVCLLITPGALPQILPVQAGVLAWVLAAADRSAARGRARSAAILHASAALLLLPACLGNGEFAGVGEYSPLVLSNFQPLWFAAGALGLLALAELWKRGPAFAARRARITSALVLAALASACALGLAPELRRTLLQAGGWFTRDEAFLTTVAELRPLLVPGSRFDPGAALHSLTLAFFLFPLAWLWLAARQGFGPGRRPATLLLLAWAGVFFVLALAQERFANAFAPALALTMAAAIEELRQWARRFGRGARLALGLALVGLVLAALAPPVRSFQALLTHSRFAHERAQGWVPPDSRPKVVVESAARWLRDASPPTRGFLDASLRPEYGVLTSWDDGHLVRYRAERPTVQDNFGSFADRRAYELAPRYFDVEDEEVAYQTARELGARYTIATAQGSGQALPPSPQSVGRRLWRLLGNASSDSPALARHRLLWVGDLSGQPRAIGAPALDRVAVFEIVPGAWVEGEARAGARVYFELRLGSGAGHIPYGAVATASPEGRYGIRLPYPTDTPVSSEVRAEGPYRVRSAGRSAELELREADVRAGATVRGPSLR